MTCDCEPPRVKTRLDEFADQAAHFCAAILLFCLFTWPLPWWEAAFFVMLLAFIRELEQHDKDWRRVGRLDLTFFAIGAACAALFI